MKIVIANRDRTEEIAPGLKAGADRLLAGPLNDPLPMPLNALSLRDAKNEAEFLDRWSGLVRRKASVDTLKFHTARKPGALGTLALRLRMALWKILRYQHNYAVARQNLINSQLTAALEFQLDEIRRLKARVDELEKRGGAK